MEIFAGPQPTPNKRRVASRNLLSTKWRALEVKILRALRHKKNGPLFDGAAVLLCFIAISCQPAQAYAEIPDAIAVKVLIAEAANQGERGMQAVAEVMRRRGTTSAFSAAKRRDLEAFVKAQGPRIRATAERAWQNSRTSNLTQNATHYENVKAFGEPWWASKMKPTVRIKDHQFYTEKTK